MIARERVFCDEKRRTEMRKEIDWNTVETVWDYQHKFSKDDYFGYHNSKAEYIEWVKKNGGNKTRLIDLLDFFWNDLDNSIRLEDEMASISPEYKKRLEHNRELGKKGVWE